MLPLSRAAKILQIALQSECAEVEGSMQEYHDNPANNFIEELDEESSLQTPSTLEKQIPTQSFSESNVKFTTTECDEVYVSSCSNERPTLMRFTKSADINYTLPIDGDDIPELLDDSMEDPDFNITSASESSVSGSENNVCVEEDKTKKKGKKKTKTPENCKVKNTKAMRNSGKEYVSSSKSRKKISARKMQPPCKESCRLRCRDKIDDLSREIIFNNYWALADLQRQREFIASHTTPIKPKYRYSCTQEHRKLNSAFYFQTNTKRVRVCKTFFKNTLDINDRPIRTALEKSESGFIDYDKRGKHNNHVTVDPEIKESVRKFINNIPRIESHYLRGKTSREYIECGKSLADLYRDYKDRRQNEQLPFANSVMFNRIFNGEFNIGFYVPRKDQCDLCESFNNADEEGKKSLLELYNHHQEEKELSRKEKERDKEKPNVFVYGLQAVLPLPKGLTSSFYYKSKIGCYNFTVSDLFAKNAECFFWTEIEGHRGAIEIGSCVLLHIESLVKNCENTENMDIIFYSDNCCGQQKNKYLLSLYLYAVQKYNIRSITHKFLIHGHSQNEGDNIHSVIEKQVKRHLKSSPVYVPEQYITLIGVAKKTGLPYRVHQLTYEDFYDLKHLQEQWGTNFNIDTDKNRLKWNNIKVLKVEKKDSEGFQYKTSYKDEQFKKVIVQNMKIGSPTAWQSIRLIQAYPKRFPLAEKKKKTLKILFKRI